MSLDANLNESDVLGASLGEQSEVLTASLENQEIPLEAKLIDPDVFERETITQIARSENERQTNEAERIKNEEQRKQNEQSRIEHDAAFSLNEAKREAYFKALQEDVDAGLYNGATFTPDLTSEGNALVWGFKNDKDLPNPSFMIPIEADVDSSQGTPAVDVEVLDTTVKLHFKNLKGESSESDIVSTEKDGLAPRLSGKADTFLNGDGSYVPISNLDTSVLTSGTISLDRLPQGALERLVHVANEAARFKLTTNEVQLGDIVQQDDTKIMYVVVDESKLALTAGYAEFTAGTASRAQTADTATRADSAANADNATHADSATRADSATNATHADSATKADTATKADSATTAGSVSGIVDIPHGGTGASTAKGAQYNLLQDMNEVSSDLADSRNFIVEYVNGGSASNGAVAKVSGTRVWTWIASKIRSVFGFTSANVLSVTNGGTGKTTATEAWTALGGGDIGKLNKGTSTTTYLRNDGTWQTPPDTNTTYGTVSTNGAGLCPALNGTATTYLNGAGQWTTPPNTNTNVTQNHSTGNAEYPVLLKNGTGTGNITSTSLFDGDVTVNPSTGTVTATTFKGSLNGNATTATQSNVAYATCDTAAATAAKVATVVGNSGWTLQPGSIVGVLFTNTNTASNVTLNVNGTGAKQIWYAAAAYTSTSSTVCGIASRVIFYMYDGTYWRWISHSSEDNTNTYVTQTATTTSANYEVLFSATADNTTRTEAARKNSNLTFNPSTGNLTATKFTGALTGNVTGNCSGSSGSCTGNAATATTASSCTGNSATATSAGKWTTARYLDGISVDGSGNRHHYATCPTAAATAAKVATVEDSLTFSLVKGAMVFVKFTNSNTVASPTLNVNSTGAKNIYRYGTTAPSTSAATSWQAGSVVCFIYDGSYWQMTGWLNDNTNTWTAFKGATSSAAGTAGYVPAPAAGDQAKFFRADGTWVVPTNTTYGAVSTSAAGLCPKLTGSTTAYLNANGAWTTPPNTNTWTAFKGCTASAAGTAGYLPAPAANNQVKFFCADGTWKDVYPVGAVYISYVSTSPATLFGGTWTQLTDVFLRAANDVSTGGNAYHYHNYSIRYLPYYGALAGNDTVALSTWNYNTNAWVSSKSAGAQVASNVNNALTGGVTSRNVSAYQTQTGTEFVEAPPPYQDLYVWRRTA